MQKGAANNMYYPSASQQQAGLAQQAALNHAYYTRSAAANLAPVSGVGMGAAMVGGGGSLGIAATGYGRGGSAPQPVSTRPW